MSAGKEISAYAGLTALAAAPAAPLRGLRQLVSGSKQRFQRNGFDLDLTYVLPQLVALGLPASGLLEPLYRNPLCEVRAFFERYHQSGGYTMVNLCNERDYCDADFASARGVLRFPSEDHHPPPLEQILAFCEATHLILTGSAGPSPQGRSRSSSSASARSDPQSPHQQRSQQRSPGSVATAPMDCPPHGPGAEVESVESAAAADADASDARGEASEPDTGEWRAPAGDEPVVAVHCKAGKGRTGVMIAAYLTWAAHPGCADGEGALALFRSARTSDGDAVVNPSQVYIYIYMYVYMCTCIHTYTHTHTHMYKYYMYIHIYIYIYIYIYI